MALLTGDGLEATYLASNLRGQPVTPPACDHAAARDVLRGPVADVA
jgi:hypothetical protein